METTLARINGETGNYDWDMDAFRKALLGQPKEQADGETADLEAGVLTGISKFEVMGIPLGNAIVGGGIAFLVDQMTERFLPQVTGPTANLAGAFFIVYFGKRFLGTSTAQAAAMFLTYEALRDTIEGALGGIFGAAQPHNPGAGLGQQPAVSGDYYAYALRR